MKTSPAILLFLFLITACSQNKTPPGKVESWIIDSVSNELDHLPVDALTITQNFQLDSTHPSIIASVKIDQLNGGCFIYQWQGDHYRLTYRKKEPVYNIQVGSTGRYLVFESGFTGTGRKNTFFHLVELTSAYSTEIWKQVASDYDFTSIGPYHAIDGSVQLSSLDHSLIYTRTERTYLKTEMDLNKPDSISCQSEIIQFSQLPARKQE